jgi:beta-glucosidase
VQVFVRSATGPDLPARTVGSVALSDNHQLGFSRHEGIIRSGQVEVTVTARPSRRIGAADPYNGFTGGHFPWTVTAAADSGPNGPVRLNLGGKCLDDTGNSSGNGNKVQMWTCNGGPAQNWTYAEDGTLRIHGKCLDVISNGTASGTGVQIWSCTGAANQQWVADTDTQFVNPVSGRCLTDSGGSTANGTKLQINSCGTGARDEWTIPAGAVLSAISGRCMDDLGNSTANGAKVDAHICNGGNPQKWTLEPDGTIRVNGKCLDDTGNGTTSGTKIQLWNCNGGASQRWSEKVSISPLGIELQHGSLCVSPTSMTAANGAQLVLGTCGSEEGNWHAW